MSKTLDDRKVNRNVRKLNRTLANDVFEDRFYARQIQKGRGDGIMYYMYELCDKEQPERNEIVPWETAFAICEFNKIWTAMNDFIITSNFWEKYRGERR